MSTLAKQDPVYEPFLADAKAELAKATPGIAERRRAARRAPTPKVQTGASVRRGQALADIR